MGGAAALLAGEKDNRIKLVVTHDSWNAIIEPDLPNFNEIFNKPVFILTSKSVRED